MTETPDDRVGRRGPPRCARGRRRTPGAEGYHVLTASSVPDAEAIRAQLGLAALGLVITNLRLTRASEAHEGIDLICRWHAMDPSLPWILMSGNLHVPELVDVPATAVWYLSKPFTLETFRDTMRTAIRA